MTEMESVDELIPYERNPRRNDKAVEAVAASIREFGFQNPIILDSEGVVIAGHTRLKAAKLLGMKKVPVIRSELSGEKARAYRLADNKTGELAEWDIDLLDAELAEIVDIDMSEFGFDLDEDFDLDVIVEDEPPAVPEEPVTKMGDMYVLGDHILLCGDSTSAADVDRLMSGDKAEMVFTDPPWNVDYGEDGNPKWKQRKILNDNLGDSFPAFLHDVFARMHGVIAGGGAVYVVMSAQEWGPAMNELEVNGFHWSSTIIWNKDTFVIGRKDYHTKYEPIWYGWEASQPRLHPLKDRTQCDVWDVDRPKVSEDHPTMKPVELVARAITNSSARGDTVLDLFGGSGSTLMACEQTGRRCRTMELDPGYCDVIVRRWETYTGKTAERVST